MSLNEMKNDNLNEMKIDSLDDLIEKIMNENHEIPTFDKIQKYVMTEKKYNLVTLEQKRLLEEFIEHRNEFYVGNDMFKKFEILADNQSNKILRILNQNGFIEGEDYRLTNVGEPVRQGGYSNKKKYYLRPDCFKICLLRSLNTRKYAEYYIGIEETCRVFKELQIKYKDKLLKMKDNKIDEQSNKIDELTREMKRQTKEMKGLMIYTKDANETIHRVEGQNIELKETVDEISDVVLDGDRKIDALNDQVETIIMQLDEVIERSVPPPINPGDNPEFILLQRRDNLNIYNIIKKPTDDIDLIVATNDNTNEYNIIKREYNANSGQLFKRFRSVIRAEVAMRRAAVRDNARRGQVFAALRNFDRNIPITFHYNTITRNGITHEQFLERFQQIIDKKYDNP